MPLQPDTEKGLWVNSDCPQDSPGLHALIIGVSRYDHLQGGKAPAPITHGLGQLSVSALTAYRFFQWLRSGYILDGWPVARVRLLMAPLRKGLGACQADELAGCDAAVCSHTPEATFENCRAAIERWYADMEALRPPAIGRSLFLFSGHGMERRQNYQILFPSDYLRPPSRPMNEAISTPNLTDALSYLAHVSSHVLLLDGCRNDIDALRGATGAKILNDEQTVATNPLFERGALYATASGLRAYSPRSGGLSLFGQALLDGLSNKPDPSLDEAPIELTHKGHVAAIEINKLASYMKGRVAALIKAAGENVVQVVRSEVASSNPGQPIEIAELPLAPADADAVSHTLDFDAQSFQRRSSSYVETTEPPPGPDVWFQERYADQVSLSGPATTEQLHSAFRSEAVTYPWKALRLFGLSTHQSHNDSAVQISSVARSARTTPLNRLQIRFLLHSEDPIGHVLVLSSERGRRSCCVLPSDIAKREFQLEIDVEDGAFINFSAYLSSDNEWPAGEIASIWDELRARDPLTAASELGSRSLVSLFEEGEELLRAKVRAPLAALVAGVVLLKGNKYNLMHDWTRNLANWFPKIPDGVVLWTEQCRRMAGKVPLEPDLLPWFVRELSRRSLPFTAYAFGLAADLTRDIVRGRLKTDDATRRRARLLAVRLESAALYFRELGLFCTFDGFPENWDLSQLGPPIPSINWLRQGLNKLKPSWIQPEQPRSG